MLYDAILLIAAGIQAQSGRPRLWQETLRDWLCQCERSAFPLPASVCICSHLWCPL